MKKAFFILVIFICLLVSCSSPDQVFEIQWNTFLGSGSNELCYSIALDSSGNIYVSGASDATWGSPVNAHSGDTDAFVACLDSSGHLLWNTFLGSANKDRGFCIALNSSGNIYVTGLSYAAWGSPINAHSGGRDAFVACLDSSGHLLWNTFLGSAGYDSGFILALDISGNIYLLGTSYATWGTPVNAHSGDYDAFVACLDSSGNRLWNTFLGSASEESGYGITLDSSGNIYVTGFSDASWGSPINAHSGDSDVFVACLDSSGNRLWNTFLGSGGEDIGYGITLDSSGNIYVNASSEATWGSPINAHSGDFDAFVACLDSSGNLLWNTFLGSAGVDYGYCITLDSSGNINLIGASEATWGSPVNAHSGDFDVFVASLDSSGNRLWNTFLGCTSYDEGRDISVDSSGNIYVSGFSEANWGSPINPHAGGHDAFIAQLSQ